jgi:hypothetical protein
MLSEVKVAQCRISRRKMGSIGSRGPEAAARDGCFISLVKQSYANEGTSYSAAPSLRPLFCPFRARSQEFGVMLQPTVAV